jgi:hypothetical protein
MTKRLKNMISDCLLLAKIYLLPLDILVSNQKKKTMPSGSIKSFTLLDILEILKEVKTNMKAQELLWMSAME